MTSTALPDEWLVVKMGNDTFVLSTNHVRELIRRQEVQAPYLTRNGIEGLTLHRGKALNVVNGVIRLGVEYSHELATTQGYFVVLDFGEQSYALAVTDLVDVIQLDASAVSEYKWSVTPAVTGVVHHGELGLMIMLDPLKLLED